MTPADPVDRLVLAKYGQADPPPPAPPRIRARLQRVTRRIRGAAA